MESSPNKSGKLYLTVDVESDYGRSDTYEILDRSALFLEWIRAENVPVTAFVVGRLFHQGHAIIDAFLGAGISLGVHGYDHAFETFGTMHTSHADEIQKGLESFERRVGRKPSGYRAALGIISRNDIVLLDKLGFRYDASVFPMHRTGRYDFSGLPKSPFRWQGTKLVEMPSGMLTSTLPAGMTFINLLGSRLSACLVGKKASMPNEYQPACHVTDIHLHNLFTNYQAMNRLSFTLRFVYLAGSVMGGLPTLARYVKILRGRGYSFNNLEADAVSMADKTLPSVGFDCFKRRP